LIVYLSVFWRTARLLATDQGFFRTPAEEAGSLPAFLENSTFFDAKIIPAFPACPSLPPDHLFPLMRDVKDTQRSLVRIGYDGRVWKTFRGPEAETRFANEVRVLRHLEDRGCPFVPRLIESDPESLRIVTTNCGRRVEHLDDARARQIFAELETYGVRHDDAEVRNITYRAADGRFCIIDFEFATILDGSTN
jgi:hypothetical protein